ncbi:MAG: DsbA family oxidoreductase [Actinomycetes bacterium]
MRIDIWSDMVCPWCYLGHRRFELALDRLRQDGVEGFDVRWRAYELDPGAPAEPGDLRAVIEKKYGPGAFDGMTSRLTALGAADGLDYRFDLAQRVNTFDAHRLTAWAAAAGPEAQDAVLRRLFRAYFSEGQVISDHQVLTRVAAEAGLDGAAAGAVLAGDDWADEVRADEAMAQDLGVGGVPAFVLDRQFLVSGAQDTETFVRLLRKVAERASS